MTGKEVLHKMKETVKVSILSYFPRYLKKIAYGIKTLIT